MKHTKLLLITVFVLLALTLAGCGVRFDLNFVVDGEVYKTVRTGASEVVQVPENPTKEGYIFDGWYWDDGIWQEPFTANSLLNAPISDNMSIYAKWISKNAEIELKLLGGSLGVNSLEVVRGEKIGTLPTPTKQGYTFKQWVDQNGNPVTEDTVVSNGLSYITATWKINSYTVTFNPDNGQESTTSNVTYGGTIVAPDVTKENHILLGWYNGDTQWDFDTNTVSDNLTLKAKWIPASYTITFDANGGSGITESELIRNFLEPMGELPIPVKDGHIFLGWFDANDTDFQNEINEFTVVEKDITLVAKWKLDETKVLIEFESKGEILNSLSVFIDKGACLGDKLVIPPMSEASLFEGWFYNGQKVTKTTVFNESAKLEAKFVLCAHGNYNHSWTSWDHNENKATCTESGKAIRYCINCGYQQIIEGGPALGHEYGPWSTDPVNPLRQTRTCARCQRSESNEYKNLKTSISETKVDGDVYGSENTGCLYNGNWAETTGTTFSAKAGNSVKVSISFLQATEVDCVFIKGTGSYTYELSVLYAGDTEYTKITDSGSFGEIAQKHDINGTITNAVIYMQNGGVGNGHWQEVAFARAPQKENDTGSSIEPQPCQHTSWTMWNYTESLATCTKDGKAFRYCMDCGFKQEQITHKKLGHDYGEDWSTDPENPLKQSRECYRCRTKEAITYTNLSSLISKTEISGNVYGENNVSCLYNGNWTETVGTFCAKTGNSVKVSISFLQATEVDCVFIKGTGSYKYELSVLYAGTTEYIKITGNGSFGGIAQRHDINGTITNAVIYMQNGGVGNGYWQEIAFCKIPTLED